MSSKTKTLKNRITHLQQKSLISKRRNRKLRSKVLKMLSIAMEPQHQQGTSANTSAALPESEEFLSSGRTGRRNALPDILNEHITVISSADLPAKLQQLTTQEGSSSGTQPSAGPSGSKSKES